jgi:hypothetical protein
LRGLLDQMSSHSAHSRPTSAPSRTDPPPKSGGLEVSTLVAAAVASVVAATVVSKLWAAGTIWATAMTPVVVALVKEAVERPARRVSSMASRAAPSPVARTARAVAEPPPEADAPPPPVVPSAEYTQMNVYGHERAPSGRRWKLAIVTGLLACLIAVAAMTLPELVAGRSVVSSSHHTTIFGGRRRTQSTPSKSETTGKKKTTSTSQSTTTLTAPDTTTTSPGQTQPTTPQTQSAPQPQATPQTQTQPPPAQTQPATPQQTTPAPTP